MPVLPIARCLATLAALSLPLCLSGAAAAGDLTTIAGDDWFDESKDGPCAARFDGVIQKGDSVGMGMNGSHFAALCLNSPGGSLAAGLELGTDSQWSARILPGDRCESACALAFLSAGYQTGNGIAGFYLERHLWAGGLLGLHSPGLQLPAEAQVDTRTVEAAFKGALAATALVYERQQSPDAADQLPLNSYLYQRFLETPPDSMYYIDTVGDTLMGELSVLGVERSARLTTRLVDTVCTNALLVSGAFETSLNNKGRKPNRSAPELLAAFAEAEAFLQSERPGARVLRLFSGTEGDVIGYGGLYPSGDYRYFRECYVRFSGKAITGERFSDAAIAVHWSLDSDPKSSTADMRADWDMVSRADADVVMDSLALFPFDDKLADLPKNALYRKYFGGAEAVPAAAPAPAARSDAAPAPAVAAAAPDGDRDWVVLIGRDVTGTDYATERSKDPARCRATCADADFCDAVTYDRWNQICFFKTLDGTARQRVMAKATSYVKAAQAPGVAAPRGAVAFLKRNDKHFPAAPSASPRAQSFEACAQACEDRGWCLGLNWRRNGRHCDLFARPPEYFSQAGTDIGYFQQAE
ncbi:hypothetical protein JYP51_02355 [Ponticoccus gilvus]|nr:hypothetical protein [Enemella evansiae]